jgi:metal-responsive CopG/Arc/MetJ family transcriptional regulator
MTRMTRHNVLSVQLTNELARQLDTVCKRALIPRSAFVRRALENALHPQDGIEAQIILRAEHAAQKARNKVLLEAASGKP